MDGLGSALLDEPTASSLSCCLVDEDPVSEVLLHALKEFSGHPKRFCCSCEPIRKTASCVAGNARARAVIMRPGHVGMCLAEPAVAAAA
jgi:hypothetical protein